MGKMRQEEKKEKSGWKRERTEWREGFQKPQIMEKIKRLLCEAE